jgi:hypothetical protein
MEKSTRFSLTLGFLLVLPFMVMEWSTRTAEPSTDFHVGWFIMMWLSAAIFVRVLMPIVHAIRAGRFGGASPVSFVLKVALLAVVAWAWVGLVIDQMPCFLGATGC